MARKPIRTEINASASRQSYAPKISLTLAQSGSGQLTVTVGVAECIAYASKMGYTRLDLTGGKTLDVKETTDQIDRLVRSASSEFYSSMR